MWIFDEYEEWLLTIDVGSPDFKAKTLVHDWRNYVPKQWQDNWHKLTERERKIIAIMAQRQADIEEWD
jgi:hypothetical protein